jgi:hypothetical protein
MTNPDISDKLAQRDRPVMPLEFLEKADEAVKTILLERIDLARPDDGGGLSALEFQIDYIVRLIVDRLFVSISDAKKHPEEIS